MLRNKLFLLSLIFSLSALPSVSAEVLSDVQYPKNPAYRVGISELPERQYVQALEEKVKPSEKIEKITDLIDAKLTDLTYADVLLCHFHNNL